MIDLYKEISFEKELESQPSLEIHLQTAAKEIAEKLPLETIKKPFFDTQFNNLIIICNLPKVPKEKLQILDKVIVDKLLGAVKLNAFVQNSLYGFQENSTMTNGSAIIEFNSSENAGLAAKAINGVALDKAHTLRVYTMEEFEKIMKVSEHYIPPTILPKSELQKWLFDKELRDQYCFLINKTNGSNVFVSWFDHLEKKPSNAISGRECVETRETLAIDWSLSGSYLVTIEKMGFQLWGGSNFEKLSWYEHLEVKNVDISPNEKYIISFNGTINEAPNTENYIVWNLRTAEKIRTFKAERSEIWGSYQWSFDSSYLARLNEISAEEMVLSVYEMPEVVMIQNEEGEKKSIKIAGLQRFSWVEKSNTLCCIAYSGTKTAIQTKVSLIEIPSRKDERKWKSILWEVTSCDIISGLAGDWLALIMIKKNKNKLSTFIHLANLKKKTLEISDMDLPEKYKTYAVDKKNGRFAFIFQEPETKEGGGHIRYEIVFLGIDTQDMVLKDFGKLNKKAASEVLFASNGTFFALVNKDTQSATQGVLEFGFFKPTGVGILCVPEICKVANMPYMTMASYDPTGRFLITGSKDTKTFIVWNAYGEQIYKDTVNANSFLQICWRKRPVFDIDRKKEEEIAKNFKSIKQKYEEHDDKIINKIKYEREEKREVMKKNFMNFLEAKRKEWEDSKEKRKELQGFDEDNFSDVSLEEIIESTIVVEEKPTK